MNVLIIDSFPEKLMQELDKLPLHYQYKPGLSRAEILELLPEAEILIMHSRINFDREAADVAKQLKLLIRSGIGMDHIDVAYLESKGVRAQNLPGVNADAVGEQTVGMLLALRHYLLRADKQVRNFQWLREANRGHELGGKTLGIIGYGNTGKATARKISGFGTKVLAYDKYLDRYGDDYAEEASMERIFQESDIVSLHIPLTAETRDLANDPFFQSFQKEIYFLNLARGPICKLQDLLKNLDQKKVVAAALDVLPNEKFDKLSLEERALYEKLFSYENVMLSPHIGGWSFESRASTVSRTIAHIKAYMDL